MPARQSSKQFTGDVKTTSCHPNSLALMGYFNGFLMNHENLVWLWPIVTFAHAFLLWILHIKFDYFRNMYIQATWGLWGRGIYTLYRKFYLFLSKANSESSHFNPIFKAWLIYILNCQCDFCFPLNLKISNISYCQRAQCQKISTDISFRKAITSAFPPFLSWLPTQEFRFTCKSMQLDKHPYFPLHVSYF